jgi:hypothetical protein
VSNSRNGILWEYSPEAREGWPGECAVGRSRPSDGRRTIKMMTAAYPEGVVAKFYVSSRSVSSGDSRLSPDILRGTK